MFADPRHYFAGVAGGATALTVAAFFVPLALAVDFTCFLVPLVDAGVLDTVLVEEAALVVAVAAGFTAGAGVCAANETAAIARVMVKPMIVETVFVIVLSVLFRKRLFCSLLFL
jgi:hypothetical protein